MRFALICIDKPGALEVRTANRAAHLDYIAATDVVEMAGPFLDEAGNMTGSLVILEVGDLAAVRAWVAGDPYGKAGLFANVDVRAWKKVIG